MHYPEDYRAIIQREINEKANHGYNVILIYLITFILWAIIYLLIVSSIFLGYCMSGCMVTLIVFILYIISLYRVVDYAGKVLHGLSFESEIKSHMAFQLLMAFFPLLFSWFILIMSGDDELVALSCILGSLIIFIQLYIISIYSKIQALKFRLPPPYAAPPYAGAPSYFTPPPPAPPPMPPMPPMPRSPPSEENEEAKR